MTDEPIRRLTDDDRPALVALGVALDWNGEDHRYRLLLDVGEVYGIDSPAGDGLIGTVTLTRFGPGFATVGMMLVHPDHGGRGYGRALMERAIAEAAGADVALFATSAGRPLYEKVGFVTLAANRSHRGHFTGSAAGLSDLAGAADLRAVIELDRQVTGCDRSRLLSSYFPFAEQIRVLRDGTAIAGYGGMWHHAGLTVIGPLVAEHADAAIAIVSDLASQAEGEVRIEVGATREELGRWATDRGLEHVSTTSLMTRDGRDLPGDRERWFMPVTLALG